MYCSLCNVRFAASWADKHSCVRPLECAICSNHVPEPEQPLHHCDDVRGYKLFFSPEESEAASRYNAVTSDPLGQPNFNASYRRLKLLTDMYKELGDEANSRRRGVGNEFNLVQSNMVKCNKQGCFFECAPGNLASHQGGKKCPMSKDKAALLLGPGGRNDRRRAKKAAGETAEVQPSPVPGPSQNPIRVSVPKRGANSNLTVPPPPVFRVDNWNHFGRPVPGNAFGNLPTHQLKAKTPATFTEIDSAKFLTRSGAKSLWGGFAAMRLGGFEVSAERQNESSAFTLAYLIVNTLAAEQCPVTPEAVFDRAKPEHIIHNESKIVELLVPPGGRLFGAWKSNPLTILGSTTDKDAECVEIRFRVWGIGEGGFERFRH